MSVIIRYAEPKDAHAIGDLLKQKITSTEGFIIAIKGENESELLGVAGTKKVGTSGVAQIVTMPGCHLHELVRLYLVAVEHHSTVEALYITAEDAGGKDFLREKCEFSFVSRAETPPFVGNGTVMLKVFNRENSREKAA